MPTRTCEASQRLANEAIRLILADDQSIFILDDVSINRMIVCGKCTQSNVNYDQSKKAFRSGISALADKISQYDEWGIIPEVTHNRRLEAGRNYRERKGEEIKEHTKDRRIDHRIQELKDQIGVKEED